MTDHSAFENFTPRANPPKQQSLAQQDDNPLTAETLATLEQMDREGLISLIQRVSGAMWGIGCMTDEQVADAMLLRLAYEGLTTKDSKTMLAAIGEWLDRVKGKAVQPVVGSMKLSYEPLVIRGMLND